MEIKADLTFRQAVILAALQELMRTVRLDRSNTDDVASFACDLADAVCKQEEIAGRIRIQKEDQERVKFSLGFFPEHTKGS